MSFVSRRYPGLVTNADGDLACAATIAGPPDGGRILVFVNGLLVAAGDGTKALDCFFSGDAGITARFFSAIAAGDRLHWNGSVAGYEIDPSDEIAFDYTTESPKGIFPDWAAERDAPGRCPHGYYHWERAAMMLVRKGVALNQWPSPFESGRTSGRLVPVSEARRRELNREFRELRCQVHAFFDKQEIDAAIGRAPNESPRPETDSNGIYSIGGARVHFAPRTLTTEHAIYMLGVDAAQLLLWAGVLPSDWPDVYVPEGPPDPVLATDKNYWVRFLFGDDPSRNGFMLEHEVQRAARREQQRPHQSAGDAMAEFNHRNSAAYVQYEADLRRQQYEAVWRHWNAQHEAPEPADPEPASPKARDLEEAGPAIAPPTSKGRGRSAQGRDIEEAATALEVAGTLPAHGRPMAIASWLAQKKPTIWSIKGPNRRIIFYDNARVEWEQFSRLVRDICRSVGAPEFDEKADD